MINTIKKNIIFILPIILIIYFSLNLLDSIFQGESQLLVVKLNSNDDGQEVRVRVPNESVTQKALPEVGQTVSIGLKVADSYVVS